MAHVLERDRRIDPERVGRAVEIARKATGLDFTADHMRELAARADRLILPLSFWWMREGMSAEDRMRAFNAAVSVMVASGRLSQADRTLLRHLGRGLGLRRADLRELAPLVYA
jgi:hypothetical protein